MDQSIAARFGAYGYVFNLPGGPLRPDPPHDWPEILITQIVEQIDNPGRELTNSRGEFPLIGGGSVQAAANPRSATFKVSRTLGTEEMAHPYLVPAAAMHAHWDNRDAFHGGAFTTGSGAWVILGAKRTGKSSFLAALAGLGAEVLADDLIVLDGDDVLGGPRSIDLRPDAAPHFPSAVCIGHAGDRIRWRIRTQSRSFRAPVAGWLILEWGEAVQSEPVEPKERLQMLARHRTMRGDGTRDPQLLPLLRHPMVRLTRPTSWAHMPAAAEAALNLSR